MPVPKTHRPSRPNSRAAPPRPPKLGRVLLGFLVIGVLAVLFLPRQTPSPTHDTIAPPPAQSPSITGRPVLQGHPRISDGDSLRLGDVRIRLNAIDAPESDQTCTRDNRPWRCGEAATQALRSLVGSSPVTCATTGTDRYGRTLAGCHVRDVDIQAWMVRNGWAVAYTRYSSDYVPQQAEAQRERLGMWQGHFDEPELWRRRGQRR